ncbi:hypothetical protein [Streptomyces sp. NPDC047108]|uniref:hypothetical protein n=1 Tax=Streptomyces sp. NPDC047108 TaxID=3155025 RepID=UPI0033EAB490
MRPPAAPARTGAGARGADAGAALGDVDGWVPYFAVEDCDAAVATATAHGGRVVFPAETAEGTGIGRQAVLRDPSGGLFAINASQ